MEISLLIFYEKRQSLRMFVCYTALYRLAIFTVFTIFTVRVASVVATATPSSPKESLDFFILLLLPFFFRKICLLDCQTVLLSYSSLTMLLLDFKS